MEISWRLFACLPITPVAAHREQIKAEIRVAYGLGDQQHTSQRRHLARWRWLEGYACMIIFRRLSTKGNSRRVRPVVTATSATQLSP